MLRERYYKRFSVWVKIIAYNAIIILCHLVKFAIFAVTNFFRLFCIAVFYIPISHKIIILLFLLQSYCFFRYFQTFFNFFSFLAFRSPSNHKFCLYAFLCSSLFRRSCIPVVFRVRWCAGRMSGGVLTIIRTRIHTRAHVRARGFLDSNF